jgi:hypothetical protein
MARAIHLVWQKEKKAIRKEQELEEGGQKAEAVSVTYEELPLDEKRQNRTSARHILRHVRAIGLDLIPISASVKPVSLTENQVEQMAVLEHRRWVQTHMRSGWEYARDTRKAFKQHNDLVPWDEDEKARVADVYGPDIAGRMGSGVLDKQARDLDRAIVRSFPDILKKAGYALVAGRQVED